MLSNYDAWLTDSGEESTTCTGSVEVNLTLPIPTTDPAVLEPTETVTVTCWLDEDTLAMAELDNGDQMPCPEWLRQTALEWFE